MKTTLCTEPQLMLAICALLSFIANGGEELHKPTARHIRYGFALQNTTAHPIPEAVFLTYAPLERTATQHCRELDVSHPFTMECDALGNRIMRFAFTNFPPYSTRIVSVKADLLLFSKPQRTPAAPAEYTVSQGLFAFDSAEFEELAPSFPVGTNAVVASRRIFDWIRARVLPAGYTRRDRGALYALRERRGDCTELTSLFVALARRDGIPSRALGGYMCRRDTILHPSGFHNWAEFYAGDTWLLADCQKNRFREGGGTYVAMCILHAEDSPMKGFPRFRCIGKGLKARMNATP